MALSFSGAGVYVGFAPPDEHEVVAHRLNQKQLRVFTGGTLAVRFDRVSPLRYYALRDPSAVKVRPIDRPPLPDGAKHVRLQFDFARPTPAKPADAVTPGSCEDPPPSLSADPPTGLPGFILTIGAPVAREEWFHQKVVCAEPQQNLAELCRRIMDLGRFEP